MSTADLLALLPLLVLSVGALLLMLQIAFIRNVQFSSALTLLIFALAALSCGPATDYAPRLVTPLLIADKLALLFTALFCLAGFVTTVLSMDYMQRRGDQPEEYYLLLILSSLGACVLAYAEHLGSLILGMELLSVALYALIAYPDKSILPLEAASKYLVLSGAASATLLFGFALLYAITGSLGFSDLGTQLATQPSGNIMLLVAMALILAGLGFKLSLVPFHMWTPDVYQGAPSPVTGFLASVAKAAIFLLFLRLFIDAKLYRYNMLLNCLALVAILSMLVGNVLALQQDNIKRMLSYSSIAHMGYLLIILVVCGSSNNRALAIEAASYYLIAYTATTLAAFGLLSLISAQQQQRENVLLDDVSGLFWQQPLLAGLMLIALLSLAGIPLTAGFVAKFYIFSAAISGYHWGLIAALILGSAIGIYYYLRVIFYMSKRNSPSYTLASTASGWHISSLSTALMIIILLLGTAPQPLMAYLRSIL
ncbi:NADH-quinone oxidoreductase subunit N [Dasania sp. GY-MA-18]|uniref:NADH-quinone oxidoreductase subunit N n=1 Tax=Dasania phycosphaerae TaxID=2950436 RepID=A0A9J6RNP8_9GAMM|nr:MULTISPECIES: NADH-quinone oxidoreductase subunit N [Dasania]MCR8923729.1 NADH-quinone oxidoreductase subunit N [Dasania sp. GY-MA-18]MCZ0866163.1 NADH-quinone oxidoreductase subunit N [Dasania phycosphaerae]MCZ0869887.1 NADH-quinone oxidoreductase subunit N [Dasania phycosphaerae]